MATIWKRLVRCVHWPWVKDAVVPENTAVSPKLQESRGEKEAHLEREREDGEGSRDPEGWRGSPEDDVDMETDAEREEKERDQYPNRMTVDEIDDIVDRQLQAYEAEWERIVGRSETLLRGNIKPTSVTVVRRGEYGQVVEIKHNEVFLRIRAHADHHVESPSLRALGSKDFEICVPAAVLGVPPQPEQWSTLKADPADVSRFLGSTKAQWSDKMMCARVIDDETAICGVLLRVDIGALKVELKAIRGHGEFPSLRITRHRVSDSIEVDISRLVLEADRPVHAGANSLQRLLERRRASEPL